MLHVFLLLLPGVLSTENWTVTNPVSICGVRGSNVTINCTFTYPKDQRLEVTNLIWCNSKIKEKCDQEGPYVYNSSDKHNQNNFQYTGNKISDCSLMISNINSTSSGVYLFRFITNSSGGYYTSKNGTTVTVTDLNVSMSRSRDNGSITVGDSLNLTCTPVSCSGNSLELQWFKDNKLTQHSGPILTFSRVNSGDSGNYSCALKNFKSSESEQIRLYVEGTDFTFWIMIIGGSIISILFIVAVAILIARKAKTQGTHDKTTKTADDVPQDEEVQYASVNIQPKEILPNTEDQHNEESTIYSAVRVADKK